jgi:hypothetical protein
MSRPPANFVAEELQADADLERENAVDAFADAVDAFRTIAAIFAVALVLAFALAIAGPL